MCLQAAVVLISTLLILSLMLLNSWSIMTTLTMKPVGAQRRNIFVNELSSCQAGRVGNCSMVASLNFLQKGGQEHNFIGKHHCQWLAQQICGDDENMSDLQQVVFPHTPSMLGLNMALALAMCLGLMGQFFKVLLLTMAWNWVSEGWPVIVWPL
jgi:hypothetical protein